jgi:hypothetical protein
MSGTECEIDLSAHSIDGVFSHVTSAIRWTAAAAASCRSAFDSACLTKATEGGTAKAVEFSWLQPTFFPITVKKRSFKRGEHHS